MSQSSLAPKLSDETRAALADRATSAARTNQPRFLVVFAGGLLAVAVVVALFGLSSRFDANARLDAEIDMTRKVESLVKQLAAIRDKENENATSPLYARMENAYTEIERIGREVGLVGVSVTESRDGLTAGSVGFDKKRYAGTLAKQETEPMLRWISRTTDELPGLQLALVELEPDIATVEGKVRWKGKVEFTRWERRN